MKRESRNEQEKVGNREKEIGNRKREIRKIVENKVRGIEEME